MESDFFSLSALNRAIETRDSIAMREFYAEAARLRIIDRDHPPSRPQEIVGRSAIADYFDDVCGRTMTHKVEHSLTDGDLLAFTQNCTYPDGTHVYCSATAALKDNLIVTQTIVQAWDA
jgi:SnoaL-like domain